MHEALQTRPDLNLLPFFLLAILINCTYFAHYSCAYVSHIMLSGSQKTLKRTKLIAHTCSIKINDYMYCSMIDVSK